MFDLVIVIITAPWFLLPGFGGSQILVLARLARLVRLFFVSKAPASSAGDWARSASSASAMLLFCSWMAYVAEHPTNPEFATFGDALWWGIVTLTTVGYGDIVPITEKGRFAGTFLMFTGVATLGVISGTLASAFRSSNRGRGGRRRRGSGRRRGRRGTRSRPRRTRRPPTTCRPQLADLRAHLVVLEQHVATLVERSSPSPPG